MTNLDDQTSRE